MDYILFKNPEAMAIRGLIAILLGIIALAMPGPTFLALAIAFGAFAMIDGVMALITLFDRRSRLAAAGSQSRPRPASLRALSHLYVRQ